MEARSSKKGRSGMIDKDLKVIAESILSYFVSEDHPCEDPHRIELEEICQKYVSKRLWKYYLRRKHHP
jgi:hypothetical protein